MLGKLPVPGLPTIWITIFQSIYTSLDNTRARAYLRLQCGWGCLDIFSRLSFLVPSPSLGDGQT